MNIVLGAILLFQVSSSVLENDFVKVFKNGAPCAAAGPSCGERVIVALGSVEMAGQKMSRGEIKVFPTGERYSPPASGDYLEVVMKPVRPPLRTPSVMITPEKNKLLYDGKRFFIFEERLEPGDTRARHSHSQRVVITLNETRLQQWPEGQPEIFRDQIPDRVSFNEPVVHVVKNVGNNPLRGIVIELKP